MNRKQKPIRVFYSPLSTRLYATSHYTISSEGLVTVTGERFDVTNDIGEIINRHCVTFTRREMPHD